MVHDTPSRQQARELRKKVRELESEAVTLAGIKETRGLAATKAHRAKELDKAASTLAEQARLEDLRVYKEDNWIETKKKGRQNYPRWRAAWREGGKVHNVYLGSCAKMSQTEAEQKAKRLKADMLVIKKGI